MLTVVAVMMTVPVIAVSALLVQFAGLATRSLADRLGTQLLDRGAVSAATDIDVFLSRVERQSDFAALKFERGALAADDPEALWPELRGTIAAFPSVTGTYFASNDGWLVGVERVNGDDELLLVRSRNGTIECVRLDGAEPADEAPRSAAGNALELSPWVEDALRSEQPVWIEPFRSLVPGPSHGTLFTAYTRNVRNADGRVVGTLASTVSLDSLGDFLRSLPYGSHGDVLVADRNGYVVCSTFLRPTDDRGERVSVAALPGMTATMLDMIAGRGLPTDERTATMRVRGRTVRGVRTDCAAARGFDWSLVATIPEADFFGEAWNVQRQLLLISGAVLGVSVVLAARLGRGLTRPILRLREHVHALGEGDFDHHMVIEALREMEDLNADLNSMAGQLRERVMLRQAIDLATEVQQSLLPRPVLRRPGLDLCGQSQYCDATGGDYYDFIEVNPMGRSGTLIAVGDVMGHGVAAALLMASARAALRAQALQSASLASMMDIVNRVLAQSRGRSWFMTMFLLMVDAERRCFRWASAGHTLALVHDPTTGETRDLEGGDLPLGIDGSVAYQEYGEDDLPPNSIILLGTDGIWEAVNEADEPFGMEPVRHILKTFGNRGAEEIASRLRDAVTAHRGETKAVDDVTFVVVRMTAGHVRDGADIADVRDGLLRRSSRGWPEPTGPLAPHRDALLPKGDG